MKRAERLIGCAMLWMLTAGVLVGCETAPQTEPERTDLEARARETIAMFQQRDPGLNVLMDKAAGYAVFPSVGKGGIGIGGAYGKGVVYQDGKAVGYCDLSQASIGFQLGGQAYRELILFETSYALERFKRNAFALAAQASAVAAKSGASADADYDHGVMVFTMARGGLMYEASVGGQKFSYVAK